MIIKLSSCRAIPLSSASVMLTGERVRHSLNSDHLTVPRKILRCIAPTRLFYDRTTTQLMNQMLSAKITLILIISYAIVHSFVPNHFNPNSNQIRAARTQPLIKKFSRRRTPTRGFRASQLRPKCNVRASPQITAFLIAVSPDQVSL